MLLLSLLLQLQPARGTFWRGRDCRDWDGGSYPGRQPFRGDETADYNCNGIWGVDPVTRKPWEDILCKDFDARGIIYIGDSIGAHFHFPESWINPLLISEVSIMITYSVYTVLLSPPQTLGYFVFLIHPLVLVV